MPRAEGLESLPLIVTSVTRIVEVDFHAEVNEKHDFLQEKLVDGIYVTMKCQKRLGV